MTQIFEQLPLAEMIGILVCLVASAFFSGSETTLTSIADTRARHLIEADPQRYGILVFWLESKRRILSGLLVGNNLVNILCSVLAYRVALHFTPSYAEALSVFGLTAIILVFAEITPKSLALHFSDRLAVPVLRIVWLVDKLFFVVSVLLTRIPEIMLRRSEVPESGAMLTEDEIEYQIRLGHDQSVFEEQAQGELLMSVVEFSEKNVKEVMIPRTDLVGLEVKTSLEEALEAVVESGHSRIPIYAENADHVLGLLHAKDLLRPSLLEGGERPDLRDMLRGPLLYAAETQKISDLLTKMRRRGQHLAIVVDEFGGTAGLITLEDIIEELVGDIRDEFDAEEAPVRRVGPETWIVDARISLHDLKDSMGLYLPDSGDYETMAGFVVYQHGRIPTVGTVVSGDGYEIRVLASDPRRVERVEIVLRQQTDADD